MFGFIQCLQFVKFWCKNPLGSIGQNIVIQWEIKERKNILQPNMYFLFILECNHSMIIVPDLSWLMPNSNEVINVILLNAFSNIK